MTFRWDKVIYTHRRKEWSMVDVQSGKVALPWEVTLLVAMVVDHEVESNNDADVTPAVDV